MYKIEDDPIYAFPRGIMVRNKKLNEIGLIVGHTNTPDSRPIIQYENGWVMAAETKNLVKGYYKKVWVEE